MEIFAKGPFELHKWHSNVKELETACSLPVLEEQTYAKEQLRTSRKEGAVCRSVCLGGKFLYHDICDAKVAWDAKLPSNLMQNWICW